MVLMGEELDNLPPKERLAALKKLQAQKREELKELQAQKEAEIRKAQENLEETLDELSMADELHADQEERRKLDSIDEALTDAQEVPDGVAVPLEEMVPRDLYGLSDYNLYGELSRLERKGYMTPEEAQRVATIRSQADALTQAYSSGAVQRHDQATGNYVSRTTELLKRLDQKRHSASNDVYDTSRRQDVFDGSGYKRD
mgnify:CR=1 FL=1